MVIENVRLFVEAMRVLVEAVRVILDAVIKIIEAGRMFVDLSPSADRTAEGERQLREIGSLRREVRSWLVRHGFHDVLLADPLEAAGAAKSVGKARDLMFDAVHMKPAGFAALAGKIRELIQQWLLSKKRKGSSIEQPAGKRARTEQEGGGGSGPIGPGGQRVPRGSAKGGRVSKTGPGSGAGRKK
jgi:hypothetical protein